MKVDGGLGPDLSHDLGTFAAQAAEQVERSRQLQGHTGVLIDGGDYGRDALVGELMVMARTAVERFGASTVPRRAVGPGQPVQA